MDWFTVDKQGLAKLLEKKGKSFALYELWQNAADEKGTSVIDIALTPVEGRPYAELVVKDDNPEGFKTLSHAFTLFAESSKKGDPTQRGRWNLGEKLVLALCDEAKITTTTGSVVFNKEGRRNKPSLKTEGGSIFSGTIRMTREEYAQACNDIHKLIVPERLVTKFNGVTLGSRKPVKSFEASLPTEISDSDGVIRQSTRKTVVNVYEVEAGETASIYEMGIPVVETGDKYHIDVEQKVPLNFDRDNVTPAYLQTVRVLVFNETHETINEEDANSAWARAATSDKRCEPEAIETAMDHRFGEKRVAFDPSDPEANRRAAYEGYTVVTGGMLNGGEWRNVKESAAILPAGRVTPSPKPYGEDGRPVEPVPEVQWQPHWKAALEHIQAMAKIGIRNPVTFTIVRDFKWPFRGTFGPNHELTLNVAKGGMPRRWPLTGDDLDEYNAFIIHEFGHYTEGGLDHLAPEYHRNICRIGARLMKIQVEEIAAQRNAAD